MSGMHRDLAGLLAYKGVHALCTVTKEKTLRATHYAACLTYGQNPIWVVYTAAGKFVRFAGSRQQIEEAYPHLTWRRKMATWALHDVEDKSLEERRREISQRYGQELP
jgi:hypothetical protein